MEADCKGHVVLVLDLVKTSDARRVARVAIERGARKGRIQPAVDYVEAHVEEGRDVPLRARCDIAELVIRIAVAHAHDRASVVAGYYEISARLCVRSNRDSIASGVGNEHPGIVTVPDAVVAAVERSAQILSPHLIPRSID